MSALIPSSDLARIRALVERVGEMDVVDVRTNEAACAALQDVLGLKKRVHDYRMSQTRPLDAAKARWMDEENKYNGKEGLLTAAEQHLRGITTAYMVEQARMVKEEEEARETRLALAQTSEEVEEALLALTAPVERDWRPGGVSLTSQLKCEITDFLVLVQAVAEGLVPLSVLEVKTSALLTFARENGRDDARIPGVRVWSEHSVAASAR